MFNIQMVIGRGPRDSYSLNSILTLNRELRFLWLENLNGVDWVQLNGLLLQVA